ncbi:unnamed protein product [Diamesa serratosioi]
MSINTAHANNGVLIHTGETILIFSDNVIMEFSGQDGALFKGSKNGRIYLTTHRVIFNNKNSKDALQSFSFPFVSMQDVELEQPVFGANYIKGKVRAQQNGNFTGEAKFKMSFKSGGCIDFAQAMLRAASMAHRNAGNNFAPPPYTAPTNGWYAAPPPAYTPNPQSYGWLPNNTAFTGAPSDGVFMSDQPPPYPGVNPIYYPPQPAPQMGFAGAPGPSYPTLPPNGFGFQQNGGPQPAFNPAFAPSMTKEQESQSSQQTADAYYDPSRPQQAFVPPPNYYENPPPYNSLNLKKQQ